jgi:hypothetical protein
MKRAHFFGIFAAGIVLWGPLLCLFGFAPFEALYFLGAVSLAVLAIVGALWFGVGRTLAALVLLAPFASHAQSVTTYSSPEEMAAKAFDAFALGDWWALGALAVFLLTQAIKSGAASEWFSGKYPKAAAFFADPRVLFLLPLVLAGLPGTLAAVKSGQPFTLGLLLKTIIAVGGGAKTIFLGWKNVTEKPAPAIPPVAVALVLSVLLSGCTATKAFIVTGEVENQVGKQFVIASNAMQAAEQSGKVSHKDFLVWAEFSARFDTFYGRGIDALKAARAIKDDIAAHDLEAAIGRIALELAGFYETMRKAGLLPMGAP